MKQVAAIKRSGEWDAAKATDFIVLDAQDRHRRRVVLVGEHGVTYLLDLPKPAQLRDGDGLVLEDGAVVRVTGKAEPLAEISAKTPQELARIAWHIGNRHTDVQIIAGKLRIRRDHVLEDMLRGLGASVTPVEAVFDPEGGAYDHGHHS
ncbi:MAG: urease accessory protein UreE [Pseudolabrys sp.]|nr:urease accessory protein UreE [Pseudolabrys sp.]MBV9956534.1 urease accessory protein UreE [Pseudolabrys sp.]